MQVQMNTNRQTFGSIIYNKKTAAIMREKGMLDAFIKAKPIMDEQSGKQGKDLILEVLNDAFIAIKAIPKGKSTLIESAKSKLRNFFGLVRTPSETSKRLLCEDGTKASHFTELAEKVLGAYRQECR